MAKEAFELWMELSPESRNKILGNVWCPGCRTAVTLCDYSAGFDGGAVVLRGFCSTCGHKAARVLEGCSESSKKVPKRAVEYYIFDIWLYGDEKCTDKKKIIRKVKISGTKSLYNFAKVITQAFEFHFDHCFGFYESLKDQRNCQKVFELFVDIGEEPTSGVAKGVKRVKISQAFKYIGEKLIMLFDYGDGWQFNVELKEIRKTEKLDFDTVVLERIGKAPLQYPPC